MTETSKMPYLSPGWIEQRETGRRNRRIVELGMGFRYAVAAGDDEKARECDRKIRELEHHMNAKEE